MRGFLGAREYHNGPSPFRVAWHCPWQQRQLARGAVAAHCRCQRAAGAGPGGQTGMPATRHAVHRATQPECAAATAAFKLIWSGRVRSGQVYYPAEVSGQ